MPRKLREARGQLVRRQPLAVQGRHRRDLVHQVVLADEAALEGADGASGLQDGEAHDAAVGVDALDAAVPLLTRAVAADLAGRLADDLGHRVGVPAGDDEPILGDDLDELAEVALDVGEVGVDVGVIELDARDDRRLGPVVEELGPLVEEGRVVLIPLDDEVLPPGPRAVRSKLATTPPMRKPGLRPADSSSHEMREVVVVLPCVPETTMDRIPSRKRNPSSSGNER